MNASQVEFEHVTYMLDERDKERDDFRFLWFIAKQQPKDSYLFEIARKWGIDWLNKLMFRCTYSSVIEKRIKECENRLYS
jgi:hypothetical protein